MTVDAPDLFGEDVAANPSRESPAVGLPQQNRRTNAKGTAPRAMDASHLLESTDLLSSQLRDLRMGRPPLEQSLEQRAALMQIKDALELYRSIIYPPPGPRQ